MYAIRRFAVRHARGFETFYNFFERVMIRLDPLFAKIGYGRIEKPVAFTEKLVKGVLFDCQMCGQCVLSSTGMSCPMNCPKNLRNGPCGGVREGGMCEVRPEMRCVWVEAWSGASRMHGGMENIRIVQPPVDRALQGSSSWLRVAREKAAARRSQPGSADPGKLVLAQAFAHARRQDISVAPLAEEPSAALASHASGEARTAVYDAPSAAGGCAAGGCAAAEPPPAAKPADDRERGAQGPTQS